MPPLQGLLNLSQPMAAPFCFGSFLWFCRDTKGTPKRFFRVTPETVQGTDAQYIQLPVGEPTKVFVSSHMFTCNTGTINPVDPQWFTCNIFTASVEVSRFPFAGRPAEPLLPQSRGSGWQTFGRIEVAQGWANTNGKHEVQKKASASIGRSEQSVYQITNLSEKLGLLSPFFLDSGTGYPKADRLQSCDIALPHGLSF